MYSKVMLTALVVLAAVAHGSIREDSINLSDDWIPSDYTLFTGKMVKITKQAPKAKAEDYLQYETFRADFYLKLTGVQDGWGSILHVGNQDAIRTPGIWQIPTTTRLHFRLGTSAAENDGLETALALKKDTQYRVQFYLNEIGELGYKVRNFIYLFLWCCLLKLSFFGRFIRI